MDPNDAASSSLPPGTQPVTLPQLETILARLETGITQHVQQAIDQRLPVRSAASSAAAAAASAATGNSVPASPNPLGSRYLPSKVKLSTPSNFSGSRTVNVDAWIF